MKVNTSRSWGAVPGAIIGGFIGGLSCGYVGGAFGQESVNYYHNK